MCHFTVHEIIWGWSRIIFSESGKWWACYGSILDWYCSQFLAYFGFLFWSFSFFWPVPSLWWALLLFSSFPFFLSLSPSFFSICRPCTAEEDQEALKRVLLPHTRAAAAQNALTHHRKKASHEKRNTTFIRSTKNGPNDKSTLYLLSFKIPTFTSKWRLFVTLFTWPRLCMNFLLSFSMTTSTLCLFGRFSVQPGRYFRLSRPLFPPAKPSRTGLFISDCRPRLLWPLPRVRVLAFSTAFDASVRALKFRLLLIRTKPHCKNAAAAVSMP